jgi:hypothetical protein
MTFECFVIQFFETLFYLKNENKFLSSGRKFKRKKHIYTDLKL